MSAPRLALRLYVAGDSPSSARSITNLKALCAQHGLDGGGLELEIVDVIAEPLRPVQDGVLVTPTLLRLSPGPLRRIIGDLSDARAVVTVLGIDGTAP